jgi:leucyl-tRNA---protein transferase
MRILSTFTAPEEICPYLADERWQLKYQWIGEITASEYDRRLADGWFKYGNHLQRPVCSTCRQCLSMRVPIEEFVLSRAQRRTLDKNSDLVVRYLSPPNCDLERIALHNQYRLAQRRDRGWSFLGWDLDSYAAEFVYGSLQMTEISVWDGDRLCAIVLCDVGKDALSGVTHYYDPEMRDRSIGLFAMLQTFALAELLGKKWVYLGYYVENSPTMGYKIQFRPAEFRDWDGNWKRAEIS